MCFKKLKIKRKKRKKTARRKNERKKENSTELQKPNLEVEVYDNNIKCDWKKKKLNWIS